MRSERSWVFFVRFFFFSVCVDGLLWLLFVSLLLLGVCCNLSLLTAKTSIFFFDFSTRSFSYTPSVSVWHLRR
jgi:hypothetical protein